MLVSLGKLKCDGGEVLYLAGLRPFAQLGPGRSPACHTHTHLSRHFGFVIFLLRFFIFLDSIFCSDLPSPCHTHPHLLVYNFSLSMIELLSPHSQIVNRETAMLSILFCSEATVPSSQDSRI